MLITSRNRWFQSNKRTALFVDVILDKVSIFGNHVFCDAHLLELVIEGPPFWRRLLLII